ncbi:uncharacterized protein DEA37_0008805 [Paragonimus westermani]|uniref:PTB domain-containing protein n=1 Tax=Paragonimus westermani TaxID=34504 RepID=A0A5J4P2Y8_9TREM|nr:uncharacterized protein DEA37_0008805 [Paragonimus westermani]
MVMDSDTSFYHGVTGDRAPRLPLIRQASDPLSHPSIRGRSLPAGGLQWSTAYTDPGLAAQPVPLFQQALLSPRIQPWQTGGTGFSQPEALDSRVAGFPSPAVNETEAVIQSQIDRLSLHQLQTLYQQLLQQHNRLVQQQQIQLQLQQQEQKAQQQKLETTGLPLESNLYATVQRPSRANLVNLLNNVQKAIAQQQQLQQQQRRQQTAYSGIQFPQVPGSGVNAAQLLSGLSTSSALTNLARALLPTAPAGIPPSDQTGQTRLPIYPTQQPPLTQNLRLTSQGFAYVPTQTRFGGSTSAGSLQNVTLQQPLPLMDSELERLYLGLLTSRTSSSLQPTTAARFQTLLGMEPISQVSDLITDPQLLDEKRRRAELQRARLLLSDQEKRLYDELRSLRQRRAGLSRQELPSRFPMGSSVQPVTPLESYRRATGRSGDGIRSREHGRTLQSLGRSGSADAARVPYGDTYDFEHSEDAALLALLEQRLARTDVRASASGVEESFRDNGDIPLRVVGPQQRSGHVVDGSSQAIISEFAPGGAVRVFLPVESQVSRSTPTPGRASPVQAPSSGGYAALSELGLSYEGVPVPAPLELMLPSFEETGEFEREPPGPYSWPPRMHHERPVEDIPDARFQPQLYGRPRTLSGSPTAQHGQGMPFRNVLAPASPSRQLRHWGQTSYDEQLVRTVDRYHSDISPGVSPVRTPSARLMRSPASPPLRQTGYDRRYPGGVLDTGSHSDTGLVGEYGSRGYHGGSWSTHEHAARRYLRPDRGSGRADASYLRGRPQRDRAFDSPCGERLSEMRGTGPLVGSRTVLLLLFADHVPEAALITLNRLSASTHIWYRPDISRHQSDDSESVRHYLIESLPSTPSVVAQAVGVTAASLAPSSVPMGPSAMSVTHGPVLLRGCSNEPIFTNLVSLLYEHVVQPLALPVTLRLPFKSLTPLTNLPSLITLSRGLDATDRGGYPSRSQRSQLGAHSSEESSRDPSHRGPDGSRRGLTRHPSDPLPGSVTVAGVGSYYFSHTSGLPTGQHTTDRHESLAPPSTGRSLHQTRSPPSAYETEYGPMPIAGMTSKWRTFTAIYLGSIDTENLTGASAIRKAVDVLLENASQVKQTEVTIKVTQDGLTVTDNWRKLFFRRHYPFFSVSYCAVDPALRCWESHELRTMGFKAAR